jgi:BstXI restriction endonuclease
MPSLIPKLPQLLARKIYKTGQTRGADDDVIFQNRVSRTSTVLIPYAVWFTGSASPDEDGFEKGFIALVSPAHYFATPNITEELAASGLVIGENALVFYETREHWNGHNPESMGWTAAKNRINPLDGQYVARIPATTAGDDSERIIRGFTTTSKKGAGIRVYEYASSATIADCRLQLEALFWLCVDAEAVAISNGMTAEDAVTRKAAILELCERKVLLDRTLLTEVRILNRNGRTICPLCLEELSAQGFFNRMEQAEGREVPDLTVTQLNLFHIEELRIGVFNHRTYNLGWGHHHCNVVVKDAGIRETIEWMDTVIRRNIKEGYYVPTHRDN